MKRKAILLASALMLAACSESEGHAANSAQAQPAPQAAAVAAASDRTMLNLSGKVVSTAPNSFRLDIGAETITVEMDDWDWFQEGRALKAGDEVSVTGRVDKGLWEQSKIEARSVYVKNLGVRFFANGADEEELLPLIVQVHPVVATRGMVTAVEGREITVGAAGGPVRVDASQIAGKPAVKVGDRVYAWGDLDIDPTERLELMAKGVVVLTPDRTKQM